MKSEYFDVYSLEYIGKMFRKHSKPFKGSSVLILPNC